MNQTATSAMRSSNEPNRAPLNRRGARHVPKSRIAGFLACLAACGQLALADGPGIPHQAEPATEAAHGEGLRLHWHAPDTARMQKTGDEPPRFVLPAGASINNIEVAPEAGTVHMRGGTVAAHPQVPAVQAVLPPGLDEGDVVMPQESGLIQRLGSGNAPPRPPAQHFVPPPGIQESSYEVSQDSGEVQVRHLPPPAIP